MSVFDLFKIGIGPSSSHTVGPMVAARRFLVECGSLDNAVGVEAALYGSLALTGLGHATDKTVILGLMVETPQDVDPDAVEDHLAEVELDGKMRLLGTHEVPFNRATDLIFHKRTSLPEHPNGMRFTLRMADGSVIEKVFYSVGGGFIHAAGEAGGRPDATASTPVRFPFDTMAQLLMHGKNASLSIPQMLRAAGARCEQSGQPGGKGPEVASPACRSSRHTGATAPSSTSVRWHRAVQASTRTGSISRTR